MNDPAGDERASAAVRRDGSAGIDSGLIPAGDADLADLIRRWQERLLAWARNGRLARAAQIALNLPEDHQGLHAFALRIAAADFTELPRVQSLDWEDMEGSACAYAPERRLILINQEWLETAVTEQVVAVLTEQLGHHLDALFNSVDTLGDEGELFLECLRDADPSEGTIALFRQQEPGGVVHLHGETLAVEAAGAGAVCLDLRDLSHPSEPPPR